jgi:hypothetical protein
MFLNIQIFNFFYSGLGKRNTVYGLVADDSSGQSALNILMIAILIYLVCSQIFAIVLKLQGDITYFYVLNLSWKFSKKMIKDCVHYNC